MTARVSRTSGRGIELNLSQLFFMGFDKKFKINLFLEHFWKLWDNVAIFPSLLSFSRIVVYVLVERKVQPSLLLFSMDS